MGRCRLYLISPVSINDPTAFAALLDSTLAAGDVACFQLRLKAVTDDALLATVDAVRPVCQAHDVALILNDRPDLAAKGDCDGVHIGQGDMPYDTARRIVGENAIVGVTCHDSRHLAMAAAEAGADYVAFGAFYPTATKEAVSHAEPDLLQWWSEVMVVPSVAIGGLTLENARPVVEAGADFLAASAAIWTHPVGPQEAVRAFNALLDELATRDED